MPFPGCVATVPCDSRPHLRMRKRRKVGEQENRIRGKNGVQSPTGEVRVW